MNQKSLPNENAELINKKLEQVQQVLHKQDFFSYYMIETLSSFAFRYFEDAQAPALLSKTSANVVAIEKGIKEAIKLKNPELRAGISDLVKRVSKEQGPTILRELKVICLPNGQHDGTCEVSARISFGHPEHDFRAGSFVEKKEIFKYADEVYFRNNLAKYLEYVCELF